MSCHHHHHECPEYVQQECLECERVYSSRPPTCEYDCRERASYHEAGRSSYPSAHNSNFKRNERLGELGALASTAFAMYEGRKAKVDPEHAQKHQLEAGAAALGAVASAGYAYYEHRQKNAHNGQRYE
ncbi:hypothetical protein KP509_21G060500 [Ceratopteris richardii]|uniref:Uncharacterized protein n=1 Tax=Ceratopteris richardii TaxID=49495 RepID=A0A8T2SAW0_CERRI|nr:hypothetical protein KP509_21G060500 [Ceratopteris richardii]